MAAPVPCPPWMHRAEAALHALLADPVLWGQVRAEVDAFFEAHPGEPRNDQSHELMTILVFERLTAQPQDQETKEKAA